VSNTGSPVHVSGQVSLQDDTSQPPQHTYHIDSSIENVGNTSVVLAVIHIVVRGGYARQLNGNKSSDDHFFRPTDLQRGEVDNIHSDVTFVTAEVDGRRFGPPESDWQFVPEDDGSDQTPTATAKVIFVQFADGATWGNVAAGRPLLVYRRDILKELIKYEHVLDDEGVPAFLHAYADRDTYLWFPLLYVLTVKCETKPDSCLIDGMHSMVLAAKQHQAVMKDKWTVSDVEFDQPR
jgi:hypothetical protein